eukprot:14010344-Alexandrium_andersonii.AAC.1
MTALAAASSAAGLITHHRLHPRTQARPACSAASTSSGSRAQGCPAYLRAKSTALSASSGAVGLAPCHCFAPLHAGSKSVFSCFTDCGPGSPPLFCTLVRTLEPRFLLLHALQVWLRAPPRR